LRTRLTTGVPFFERYLLWFESGSTPDTTVISHDDIKVTPPKGGPGSSRRATTSSKRRMPPIQAGGELHRQTKQAPNAAGFNFTSMNHIHPSGPAVIAAGGRARRDLRVHDRNLTRGYGRPVRRRKRKRGRVERYKASSRGAGPSTVSLLSANSRHALITAEDKHKHPSSSVEPRQPTPPRHPTQEAAGCPKSLADVSRPPSRGRAGTSRRPREVLDRRTIVASPAVQRGECVIGDGK
jgi:hypothetical protein